MLVVDRRSRGDREIDDLQTVDAIWMGVAQALALSPGVSRSGVTITAARARDLRHQRLRVPAGRRLAPQEITALPRNPLRRAPPFHTDESRARRGGPHRVVRPSRHRSYLGSEPDRDGADRAGGNPSPSPV